MCHLLLFAGSEVILDVESLPNLLRSLALDHVGHRLAGHVQEALNVQIVGGENELEESSLIHLNREFRHDGTLSGRSVADPVDIQLASLCLYPFN